ncbi:MAG: transcriptional regulator [Bacteroidales bacterium]|nr:transcriptional regulator [Bacteroidales bacterium]MDD3665015.1 transcriptional regulator [Bacteroidales bacterium]
MDTHEAILHALQNSEKPMKAGEIANAIGIDKKEVDKSIKTLVKESKLHSPMRCYYALTR